MYICKKSGFLTNPKFRPLSQNYHSTRRHYLGLDGKPKLPYSGIVLDSHTVVNLSDILTSLIFNQLIWMSLSPHVITAQIRSLFKVCSVPNTL